MKWIDQLTSLQDLSLYFGRSHRNVLHAASLLTKITRLDMSGQCGNLGEASVLSIDIGWHRLQALQDITLCSVRLKFGDGVAGLSKVQHLTQISFVGSTTHDNTDKDAFAALLCELSMMRPRLKLLSDLEDFVEWCQ